MTGAVSEFDRFSRRLVTSCFVVAAVGGVGGFLVAGPAVGRGFALGALGAAAAVWVHGRGVAGSLGCTAGRAARRARLLWALRFTLRAVPPCVAALSPRFPLGATLVGVLAVQGSVLFAAASARASMPVSRTGARGVP